MSEFSKDHYLNAIIADIRAIRAFVGGMNFDDYADDLKTQYATERAILNISEAVRSFEKHGKRVDPDFSLDSVSPDIEWAKSRYRECHAPRLRKCHCKPRLGRDC